MTSVPIDLPIKTGESAVLAEIIFDQAEGRKLNDGVRSRIGARLASLQLSSMQVFPGSLQRDPVHPSTYYVVVDPLGAASETRLLRLALASSPSSGLFPNSLLIGRMRTTSGREIVVNAIPFSLRDHQQIRAYAENVDRDFLPRVKGAILANAVWATVESAEFVWHDALWRVVRAGWRESWSAVLEVTAPLEGPFGHRLAGDFTRFSISPGPDAIKTYDFIRSVRRQFDCEIDLRTEPAGSTAEHIAETLQSWRAHGKPVQFIAPHLELEPRATFEDRLRAIHEAARLGKALLSLEFPDPLDEELAAIIGKVTGGRVNYRRSTLRL